MCKDLYNNQKKFICKFPSFEFFHLDMYECAYGIMRAARVYMV